MHKSLALLLAVVAVPAISVQLFADATTAPATSPATTTTAAKPIEFSGYLAPVDAQEAKPKLKRPATPLTVTEVVPHGSSVRAGQVLIKFDLSELDQDIVEAVSDLEVAKAARIKAESDVQLAEQAEALTLEERTDDVADAEADVAWWRDIEGPDFLKRLDQTVKASADSVEDQNDELEQLRAMYKSEELTNATADIVVKRAVRTYENSKLALEVTKHTADKQRAIAYPDREQAVKIALEKARHALSDAKATAAQAKVTRAASLLKARNAERDAQKKLSELEQDKAALEIKAKSDGVLYYGAFTNGQWQGSTAEAIKVDEKADPAKALLTVVQPGKLRVVAKVDEANLFKVTEGAAVVIKPAALAETKLEGKLTTREPLASADGMFEQKIELSNADPRLLPGMKVKVELAEQK